MELIINGENKDVAATTVEGLLAELDLAGRPVAVEVNKQLVPKRQHAEHELAAGDQVEIVGAVGGG